MKQHTYVYKTDYASPLSLFSFVPKIVEKLYKIYDDMLDAAADKTVSFLNRL